MKKRGKTQRFTRQKDPYCNPDDEEDYRKAYGDDDEAEEEDKALVVNELFLQSFIDTYQPERDEHLSFVRALSMGELRDMMQVYRTFDCKTEDPLPLYLAALAGHGFRVTMGFSGEQVILVSRREGKPDAISV